MNLKKNKLKVLILYFYYILLCITMNTYRKKNKNNKRIGIVGFSSDINIGNNLIKYSMYIILKRFNYIPTLIAIKTNRNTIILTKR